MDALTYVTFQFEDGEWDNVPTVVPKHTMHLEKYLGALSSACRGTNATVDQRFKDVDEKIEDQVCLLTEKLEGMREIEIYEKELMSRSNYEVEMKVTKFVQAQKQEQSESQLAGSGVALFKDAMREHLRKASAIESSGMLGSVPAKLNKLNSVIPSSITS